MRVLTVDDNPFIRAGLTAVLEVADGVTEVLETDDPQQAVSLAEGVDVVLLDVQMPAMNGLELLPRLIALAPVVMLTHRSDAETLSEAMAAGASGYVVHGALEPDALVEAIRVCLNGSTVVAGAQQSWGQAQTQRPSRSAEAAAEVAGLSSREVSIMEAMAAGQSNPEIAASLFLAPKTIKNNINRIFAKLAVSTRTQAVLRWQELAGGQGGSVPTPGAGPQTGGLDQGPYRGPRAL